MDDGVTDRVRRVGLPWSLGVYRGRDKRRRGGRHLRAAAAVLIAGVLGPGWAGAQSVPPDEAWRTLHTPHFRVTFPAALEPLGRRTAVLAERARTRLAEAFLDAPGDPIDVVLTDHVDASNGFASVAPRRRIVVYARPPVDGGPLSHYDDWLDLVLVHELAHVVHLDRTGGIGRILRSVFGRVPATWFFFPGLAVPRWVVEGLATWYESDLTAAGRVHGTAFPMQLRTAALAGRLEPVDRASGESALWPGGQRPYLYGSFFFDWLLERHGEERMAEFVDAVAGQWIPYRVDAAARKAFGESFSEAWRAWAADVEAEARSTAAAVAARFGPPAPELLTRGSREALHPRLSPDGRTLAYARADGRDDPHLRLVPAGEAGGREDRVRTNGAAAFDWLPDGGIVFQQFALEGPWRIRGDLFVRSPDGAVRRLTRGARLDHPSSAPDGRWVAAVRTADGRTELVRVALEDGSTTPLAPGSDSVHWAFPAVSPDGRWIAASRWRPGERFDVVVVDAADGREALRVGGGGGLDLAPAWSPDGRWLVWASDRSGIANLMAAEVDPASGAVGPLRQVTDVVSGVAFPSVSPDGRWIHHSLYTADGWEVARVPFDPAAWRDPVPAAAFPEGGVARVDPRSLDTLVVRPYRSLATLRPLSWTPAYVPSVRSGGATVLGPFLGAATEFSDVVGRQLVALGAAVAVDRGKVDASGSWTWMGWGNPLLSVSAVQEWDAAGPFTVGEDRRVFVEERERRAAVAVTLLRARWRSSLALTPSLGLAWEDRALLDADDLEPSRDLRLARPSSRLADLRLSLSWSTARSHALSLSPEDGLRLFARVRARPQLQLADTLQGVVGRDRTVREAVGEVRAYRSLRGWGWADHVLALRVAGGRAVGPGADAFWYDVGGAAGRPEAITGLGLAGGRDLFFPVRGFLDGDRSGSRAWAASAEWRFPLAWPNRGWRLWPLHLDRLHGAVFADAGNAWGPGLPVPGYQGARRDAVASMGLELRLDALLFFSVPLQVRLGAAHRLTDGGGTRVHLRLGPPF